MPQQSVVRLLTVQPFQLLFALVGRIFQLFLSVVTRGRIKARRSSSTQLSRQMKAEAELMNGSGAHPAKNNIYEDFDILAEHCLSVSVPAHNTYATNGGTVNCTRAWIEGKRWEFAVTRHTQSQHTLRLWLPDLPDSSTSSSQCSVTVEYIFWQWHRGKQVYILQKGVKCFQPANNQVQAQFSTGNSNSACPSDGYFNALIRVLEKQQPTAAMAAANKSLCPTLDDPEANVSLLVGPDSFAVSMHYLMAVSPVFQKMFSIEMLEKVHREVTLEEIGPDEFRAFLRAISPQQVHPNPYNVCELLRLADRFQVEPLRRRCEAHLVNCVEMPLIERLLCAEVYRLEQLKNYVLKSLAGSGLRDFYEENQAALNLLSKELLIQLTSRICSSARFSLCHQCQRSAHD